MKRSNFGGFICLAVFALGTVGQVLATPAGLVAHWALDDGAGQVARDSSANSNDGTLNGGVQWTEGLLDGALEFDGSTGYVQVPFHTSMKVLNEGDFTIAAWCKPVGVPSENKEVVQQGDGNGTGRTWLFVANTGEIRSFLGNTTTASGVMVEGDTWYHVAAVVTEGGATDTVQCFVNGEAMGTAVQAGMESSEGDLYIGCHKNLTNFWDGLIDDVVLFKKALSAEELQDIMGGLRSRELASAPNPASETTDVSRDVILSWSPGETAVKHDVYLGTNFDDVNDANPADDRGVLISQGQETASLDPGRLEFDTTYFWRVDEVNNAPNPVVAKGEVWNFTVESFASPVTGILATASSAFTPDMDPMRTVDGSGLDADGLHNASSTDMWLTSVTDTERWIQYEFDKVYKLHEMWIWNSNQIVESFVGFGAKEVTVEISVDGVTWTTLENSPEFAQAPGLAGYAHNTVVPFDGQVARFVKLTIVSGWGVMPQSGLSEVRFLAIPVYAREPQPADGATTDSVDVTLAWRPGRGVASHRVILSEDPNAVMDNSSVIGTPNDAIYQTGPLNYASTYSWRIVEVNKAEAPSEYASDIWRFTTPSYGVIDDMESYKDEEFKEPWATWIDGYQDESNGSLIGAAPDLGNYGPETGILHGDGQSLPMQFDNSSAPHSEATRSFDSPLDFTASGVQSLVLYFHGSSANTGGRFYVRINDTKVAYEGDADVLQRLGWHKWTIRLSDVSGTDLSRVNSLTVGVDNGGQGMVYVDDIFLSPELSELITPVQPGTDGLVAHYALEGNVNDSTGQHPGTVMGLVTYEAGAEGQALVLSGLANDYVTIAGYQGIVADADGVQQPFSVACWFKTQENGDMVSWGSSNGGPIGGQYLTFRIDGGSLRVEHGDGNLRGNTICNDGEWHHGALTVIEGADLRVPQTKLYIDGQADGTFSGSDNVFNLIAEADVSIGNRASHNDRFFPGALDEVRIYDRVLSTEEVAGLAGRVLPFNEP